jgi:hypothetical protein
MNLIVVNLWNRPPACEALLKPDGYDLAIINPTDKPYLGDHTYQLWHAGYKYPNMAGLVDKHPEITQKYDYIWLLDDDVRVEGNPNRLFEIMEAERLDLAQPSLTHHSYYSHEVTLKVVGPRYRLTSFVEIMAPCFSRDALKLCGPTFVETYSGWGLDWVWPQMLMKVRGKPTCAIVDEMLMTHTQPCSSGQWRLPNRKTPEQEMREIWAKYNPPGTIVYAAVQ